MFKRILFLLIVVTIYVGAKNIVVITDMSQGIQAKEASEVMGLINPNCNKPSPIYENNDKFYGYIFTENGRLKKSGTYKDKSTSLSSCKKFFGGVYAVYFKTVKKGLTKGHKPGSSSDAKDIVFLIDTSGSMKKNDVEQSIKDALDKSVSVKGEKVNIALVTYDGHQSFDKLDNSRVLLDFTNDISKISRAIDSIEFSNFNTLLGDGLALSIGILNKRKTKSKMIVLLSDGDKVFNKKFALDQMQYAKKNHIIVKPFAIGGASISTLSEFSSNGKVYDVTSNDFGDVILPPKSEHKDTLFQNFASLSSAVFKKNTSKDGVLIIYSNMMETSDLYDFNMIPNLSDDLFFNEVKEKLHKEHLNIDFNGMKVYVRLTGNPSAKKENELIIFWKRFIKEHNGKVEFISKDDLTLDEMGY